MPRFFGGDAAFRTHSDVEAGRSISALGDSAQLVGPRNPDHQKEGAKHGEESGAHERIKKHHHTMIAQFSLLLKAMAQPV
jgi:hypothetical protein